MFCPKCGKKISDDTRPVASDSESIKFCPGCGGKLTITTTVQRVERGQEPEFQKTEARSGALMPKKSKKKIIAWAIIIILFAAVGIGREIYINQPEFLKNLKEKFFSSGEQGQAPGETEEEEGKETPAAGEKTTSYQTFSVASNSSFKYPSDWTILDTNESQGLKMIALRKDKEIWLVSNIMPKSHYKTLLDLQKYFREDTARTPGLIILNEEITNDTFSMEVSMKIDPDNPLGAMGIESEKSKPGHGLVWVVDTGGEIYFGIIFIALEEKWSQYEPTVSEIIKSVKIDAADFSPSF